MASASEGPGPSSDKASEASWWRQAVVYQIYPRSFADSNGDGIGDLNGITSRIDYLASLGVDAVWLSPFYPSALADGGYDVDDYRNVDPKLGTLAEFDAMVSCAARRRHQAHRGHRAQPHLEPARLVHRSACLPTTFAGPAAIHLPGGQGAGRLGTALGLDVTVRRTGLAPSAGRAVVSAPFRPRAARPELGQQGGPRRLPRPR